MPYMRADPIEQTLNAISDLRTDPDHSHQLQQLKTYLGNRSNLVVAKAARLTRELAAAELTPDLVRAFQRVMTNPMKLDKGCAALLEIVAALYALDYDGPDLYIQGVRHIQMEAAYGEPIDTAVPLRSQSALALVRTRHPDAVCEVVTLLADKEPRARMGAAQAIGSLTSETGELLLRLKVLDGDYDPEVLGECFRGILRHDQERAVTFVGGYADHEDQATAEAALIALGESRRPRALELLHEKWDRSAGSPLRKTILLAFAIARQEPAIEFLLSVLAEAHPQVGADVIAALQMYRDDDRIRPRIEKIIRQRADHRLTEAFKEHF